MNEILGGKRENYAEFEGIKYPAEKFKVRVKDGKREKDIIIDLKGGITENG